MKGQVNVYYAKGLFKSGIALGAGLVVGKCIGNIISSGINGAITGFTKGMAENGNEKAQKICRESGIEYDEQSNKDSKVEMGFHCS